MEAVLSPDLGASFHLVTASSTLRNDGFYVRKWSLHMCVRRVCFMEPKFEKIHILGWRPHTHRQDGLKGEMLLVERMEWLCTLLASARRIVHFGFLGYLAQSQSDTSEKGIVVDQGAGAMANRRSGIAHWRHELHDEE